VLAAQICLEVARGLAYAHRLTEHGQPLGLVHRDVTPHNVLVSYEGAVKLTDFGIAKASNRASTAGMLKGKFAYMAPEQARGEPVDARTDLFALGITLWELLTGARLFDGDSDLAVLRAVQERQILSPSAVNRVVDPALAEVVMTALQREPARRFQTATELERRLLTYVIGAPRPRGHRRGALHPLPLPDEAAAEEDTEPMAPLQLVPGTGPTSSRAHSTARSGGLQQTRPRPPGACSSERRPPGPSPRCSRTRRSLPPGPPPPPVVRGHGPRRRQSVVTEAPVEEMRVLAAQIGARRRRTCSAILGLAVLLGVGAIAFVAGGPSPGRNRLRPRARAPPGRSPWCLPRRPGSGGSGTYTAPIPPDRGSCHPPGSTGFSDGEGPALGKALRGRQVRGGRGGDRRLPLGPGSHTLRLVNGKKARSGRWRSSPGKP
jgi:serine/threonine-protein kinase